MRKPRLSSFQIWNMCFGFLGVQIGFGLQNANTSRIFQTLGAQVDNLPILWIAAPVTGLLVQPVIGYLSDRTWGRLGRRRPYFLVGAVLAALGLLLMPLSHALWVAAALLWVIDGSINITMEPFRAFVGDLLPDEQRTQGFAMQSFFIGAGAVLASVLPWLLTNVLRISNVAPLGVVPPSVMWAYFIGAAGLVATVLWTVVSTKEYPPDQVARFEVQAAVGATLAEDQPEPAVRDYSLWGVIWLAAGCALTAAIFTLHLQKELYVLGVGAAVFGLALLAASLLAAIKAPRNGYTDVLGDLMGMPRVMKQLAVVQLFSWFGLFSMWIDTNAAVAAQFFGTTDTTSKAFNQAGDWEGVLFGVYNGVAALAAFLLPVLATKVGRRAAHAISLVLGAVGLASFLVIRDPVWLLASMVGVGVAWASILSAPYSILSGALPSGKMGVYMGIFNIFIVVPQILAATLLALLLRIFFGGQPIYALLIGGVSLALSAVAVLFVADPADPVVLRRRPAS